VWYAVNGSLSGELRKIGDFSTDRDGLFTLKSVEPGWYRITETEPAPGYAMKEPSTLDVFMEADQDKTVTFENQPLNSLIIKKVDATDGHVLQGAKFRVRYFEGVTGTGGTTIGEYETSANGTIVITGLKAGTYIIEETHAPEGYIIDDAPKTVYVSGKEQASVTVEFANQPDSGLTITKLDSVTKKPLAGAVFEIRNSAGGVVGNSNGIYTTDESGTIHLPGLPTDTYVIKETKAPAGYVLDGTPQTVKLIHGETHSLTFYNAPKGSLVVVKLDADTKKPLAGATFKITTSSGEFVAAQGGAVSSNGLYTTDKNGQIILTGLQPNTYVVTETKAPDGYELDAP
ncbi:MAG: SpaA isopeptide-forming pilin-related protein, partial [Oscillospiraceae bacterium]